VLVCLLANHYTIKALYVLLISNIGIEVLKDFLALPNEIPSHDILGDLFARLCPDTLQTCFLNWVHSMASLSQGEVVAIDGKTLRRSFKDSGKKGAIHMVSTWATGNQLVLGQYKVDEKTNEITAIPELISARTKTHNSLICIINCSNSRTKKVII